MKKYILYAFLGGALLLNNKPTQCTNYKEIVIMGCGVITMVTGLYLLTEKKDSALDNMSKYITSMALLSSGLGSIVLSSELTNYYQDLITRIRRTIAGY